MALVDTSIDFLQNSDEYLSRRESYIFMLVVLYHIQFYLEVRLLPYLRELFLLQLSWEEADAHSMLQHWRLLDCNPN